MEVLWIIANVLLGVMLWDIHRGVGEISATTKAITAIAKDISAKTDELLRRVPPTA